VLFRSQEQNRLAKAMERLNAKLRELLGLETDPMAHTPSGYKSLIQLIPYKVPDEEK
jgi:hypothetical protein